MPQQKADEPFSFLAMIAELAALAPQATRGSNMKRSGFKPRLGHGICGRLDAQAIKFAQEGAVKRRHLYMNRGARVREGIGG